MSYKTLPKDEQFTLRLPSALKEELIRRANEIRRSLGDYIILLLDQALEKKHTDSQTPELVRFDKRALDLMMKDETFITFVQTIASNAQLAAEDPTDYPAKRPAKKTRLVKKHASEKTPQAK